MMMSERENPEWGVFEKIFQSYVALRQKATFQGTRIMNKE
jgi:hypothetical protein